MKQRFLFSGDIHLGNHGPLEEEISFEVLEWLYEVADEEKVDGIFIAGDLFKSGNPKDSVKSFIIDLLLDRKGKDIPTRYISGNHDFIHKSGYDLKRQEAPYSSVDILGKIKQIIGDDFIVHDVPITEHFRDCFFSFVPFSDQYSLVQDTIGEHFKLCPTGKDIILVAHFPITNTRFDNGRESKAGVSISLFSEKRIRGYIGHFHNRQIFGNSMYVGSPYPQKIDEKGDKGIWIVETNNGSIVSNNMIVNTFSPKFISVVIDLNKNYVMIDGIKINNLNELLKASEQNVVSVKILSSGSRKYEDFKTENTLLFEEIYKVSYKYDERLDIISDNRVEEKSEGIVISSFDTMFFEFADTISLDEDLKPKLVKLAEEVLHEEG